MAGGETYTFKVLRYDAREPEREPAFSSYRVRVIPGLTVLTVLLRIRDELDGTLAFRSSCRAATCGSCAMVINGRIDLACRTQAASFDSRTIILEPLPNLDVVKDLVVDMAPFWTSYERITPWLVRETPDPRKEIAQSEKERGRIDQFVNCILCACCYGACECSGGTRTTSGPRPLRSSNGSWPTRGTRGPTDSWKPSITGRPCGGAERSCAASTPAQRA
jgi:succinate dehydrogenase/fumarate reductase iron-sulfur protein